MAHPSWFGGSPSPLLTYTPGAPRERETAFTFYRNTEQT